MNKITTDYISLRKSISGYVNKYPASTRESNKKKLERLQELKSLKDKSSVYEKEYYKIRNDIAISNGGFAMTYVMKYNSLLNNDVSISELFQEATIGIIEAIDTFDLSKNTSFTTYAFYHVKKRIIDYIKKNKLVKAPRDVARNLKHVNEAKETLLGKEGIVANAIEIKKYLSKNKKILISLDTIESILILLELNSAGVDDSFISEYNDQSSVTDKESTTFRKLELNILSSIQNMSEKDQRIIRMRFGLKEEHPYSIEEIKFMLNVTDKELESIGK